MKLKDFKITGTIGCEGANRLSFSSIQYQVDNARKLKYPKREICAGIIRAMGANDDLRNYFESNPETSLDTMMDIFRSTFKERDSASVFTDFQNEYQVRKKVATLSAEEGIPYDSDMLARRFFHVMFTGVRNDNIRTELREKCREDYKLPNDKILKFVSEIVAVDTERKEKLSCRNEASLNMMEKKDIPKDPEKKQERQNPFVMIEELKVSHTKEMAEMRNEMKVQLLQIEKAITESANTGANRYCNDQTFQPSYQAFIQKQQPGGYYIPPFQQKKKVFKKCQKCHADKMPR